MFSDFAKLNTFTFAVPRASSCHVRRRLSCICLLILFPLLPLSSVSDAQSTNSNEYRAKANFLAAFPNFVEWPAAAFSSEQAPIVVCVVGDYSFGTSLAEATRTIAVHGRRIDVRWVRKEPELRACHILFISRSEEKRYASIFKAIQGASVLTVGETPDFLERGGAINFVSEEEKLEFEVSMDAVAAAHLSVSSNMLALAKHVVARTRAEAAKS